MFDVKMGSVPLGFIQTENLQTVGWKLGPMVAGEVPEGLKLGRSYEVLFSRDTSLLCRDGFPALRS